MHVEPGMPLQPLGDPRMFMGGVIVGNDVDVEIGRALLIDEIEKGQPFLMTMARCQMGDELAVEIIERGEQGQRAVPHVIMGLGPDVANSQRQTRLRALERAPLTAASISGRSRSAGRFHVSRWSEEARPSSRRKANRPAPSASSIQ